jgi:hypothetical protein
MVSKALLNRALVDLVRHMCKRCVSKSKPKGADWHDTARACTCRDCAIWHTRPGNPPNLTGEPRPC